MYQFILSIFHHQLIHVSGVLIVKSVVVVGLESNQDIQSVATTVYIVDSLS